MHLKQLAPLHQTIEEHLSKAKKSICIENNATGQLAKIIDMETKQTIDSCILKYNGLPFSKEELVEKIKSEIREV
jgi:2-oxoglutarate ferredoxin oxidoreductase subunit alpha